MIANSSTEIARLGKYSHRRRAASLALIFTHILQHTRLEIPMDLRDPSAFSPPLPE